MASAGLAFRPYTVQELDPEILRHNLCDQLEDSAVRVCASNTELSLIQ
jgi:hypothetical protein